MDTKNNAAGVPTEAQIVAAARKMCDQAAASCGIHPDDNWNIYGDEYRIDAREILEAALAAAPTAEAGQEPCSAGCALNPTSDPQNDCMNCVLAEVAPSPAKPVAQTAEPVGRVHYERVNGDWIGILHDHDRLVDGAPLYLAALAAPVEVLTDPLKQICEQFGWRTDGDAAFLADRIAHHVRDLKACLKAHEAVLAQHSTKEVPSAPVSPEHAAILDDQVARWRKEVERLQDLIATATGKEVPSLQDSGAGLLDKELPSIDTPEFNALLGSWMAQRDYYQDDDAPLVKGAWANLIDYINARLKEIAATAANEEKGQQ